MSATLLGDLPGIHIGAVWTGSLVTGWAFHCSRSLAPRCKPQVFSTEQEARERAADHWNLHEQVTS